MSVYIAVSVMKLVGRVTLVLFSSLLIFQAAVSSGLEGKEI